MQKEYLHTLFFYTIAVPGRADDLLSEPPMGKDLVEECQ